MAWRRWLRGVWSVLGSLTALLCVVGFFAVADWLLADGTFFTQLNLRTVAVQNCYIAVAALGMTVIIIAGGIDLSAGTAMALCATTLAWGIYEDVGFVALHGNNFVRASSYLEQAQKKLQPLESSLAALRKQRAAKETGQLDPQQKRLALEKLDRAIAEQESQARPWREEVQRRKQPLLEIARLKLEYARQEAAAAPPGSRKTALMENVAAIGKKIAKIEDPAVVINVDDAWLQHVPNSPWSGPLAVGIGLLTGLAAGVLNGLLISALRVVPFVVTLGTLSVFLGLGNLISDNKPIRPMPNQVPEWLATLVSNREDALVLGFSTGVWLLLVLALLLALVLRYTVFGRHVFALGSNESTARLCGINVPLLKIAVYAVGGLFVGVAGMYFFARLSAGNPTDGRGQELKIIAAVVIGGASLSGGRGNVLGSIAGAAMIVAIESGCTQLGLPDPIQLILLGAVIIAAAAIDQWRQRRAER